MITKRQNIESFFDYFFGIVFDPASNSEQVYPSNCSSTSTEVRFVWIEFLNGENTIDNRYIDIRFRSVFLDQFRLFLGARNIPKPFPNQYIDCRLKERRK